MSEELFVPTTITEQEKNKQDRSAHVLFYTSFFSLLGLILIAIAFTHLPADFTGLVSFVSLGVLAEALSAELFISARGSRVSAAGVVAIASILTFGPAAGIITNMVCGIISSLSTIFKSGSNISQDRAGWFQRTFFNIGMLVTSTGLAGLVYILSGGSVGAPDQLSNLVPILLMVTTSELSNLAILIGVLWIQTGEAPGEIWVKNFRWAFPIGVAGELIVGTSLAIAFKIEGLFGLITFFLPVLAITYSFRMYADHTREHVNRLEEMNKALDETNLDLLESFGAVIDAFDKYTYGHSAQVAVYVRALADRMGLPKEERSWLVKAALIHDIGKIGIHDNIISKQGPLDPSERVMIQRHAIIGADITRRMKGLQKLVPLVRHHHERWDGSGYPSGLYGEEIPLGARILTLADAVDSMCSDRPYRKTKSIQEVEKEVNRCSGSHFDPKVVEAFNQLLAEKGPGFFKNSAETVDQRVLLSDLFKLGQNLRYLKSSELREKSDL